MTDPILAAYIQGGATVLAAVLAPVLARWLHSSPPAPSLRIICITGNNSCTRILRITDAEAKN